MILKIILPILGILNGGWMLADGIFVMLKGKCSGPAKPGQWANLFYKMEIDVFKLGPLFILFGIAWLIFVFSFATSQVWSWWFGLSIAVFTLWYLPVGTIISVV